MGWLKNSSVRFLLIVLTAVLTSCGSGAPVFDQLQWRLLHRDGPDGRHEELALFLRISDPDGDEDLALVTVRAGESGLFWDFPQRDWIKVSTGNAEWVGMPALVPSDGFRLPDERYTVRVEDLAGQGSELTFRPDPARVQPQEDEWPQARIENNRLILEGPYSRAQLIIRDQSDTPVRVSDHQSGDQVDLRGADWWELWISVRERSGGFRLGPYPVPAGSG